MARIIEFEGRRIEVPDDATDDEVSGILSAQPAAQPAPEQVATPATTPAPAAPVAEQPSAIAQAAGYADDTAAIGLRGARSGVASMLGAPVDIINNLPRLANLIPGVDGVGAMSEKPMFGGAHMNEMIGAPEDIARTIMDQPAPQPQDAVQRVVGRVGQEIGAAAVPYGAALGVASRVGAEGAREMGTLGRLFVEPAAVAPVRLAGQEAMYATGSGLGAGIANEAVGNPQQGDNFWSDFLGSLAGTSVTAAGNALLGPARNLVAGATGNPRMMDDIAGQEVADRIINNSSLLGEQFATTGRVDTTPLAAQLRRPAPVEEAVPGYVANIGDRAQDPLLMTAVQNQDMLTPGAANLRRTTNDQAVTRAIDNAAPQGDPAQFRAALEANRDAQLAEAIGAEDMARQLMAERQQGVTPMMPDATARGSSVRAGLQDAADNAQEIVRRAFAPIDESQVQVPVAPLAERFGSVTENLPMNARARFMPSEANLPARMVEPAVPAAPSSILGPDGRPIMTPAVPASGNVPLNEVTSIRSGLTDDVLAARATPGQANKARIADTYRREVDKFMDQNVPAELRETLGTARATNRDVADRFKRPGTGIADVLRPREGGGYQMDDSAVAGRFTPTDQGRLDDMRAALREAGTDPRVRGGLADEVLSDVQRRGLIDRPEQLADYMTERSILLKEFPELRQKLTEAGAASEYLGGVEAARKGTERRLTTPGRSAQASYLKYGDEATVDAVRNLTSGPQPREATRELLEAAGNTPEARVNARSALWEAVKTKKYSAPGATGGERWDTKKLKAFFEDPKTAAVADELWSDAPDDLASIKDLFGSLAGAEGSIRTRAAGSSGTGQALNSKFDSSLSASSIASRARSVNRGQLSPVIAGVDILSTWLRNRSKQVQSRAIDTLASSAFNNPGLAADLLEQFNPADFAAKRRMLTQKYGVRATQVINLLDEAQDPDGETKDAIMGDADTGVLELTVKPRKQ